MLVLIITLILLGFFNLYFGFSAKLPLLGHQLQNFCVNLIPASDFIEIKKALYCGQALPNFETKELLKKSSLIHLIVVSKTHLLFWAPLCELILLPLKLAFPSLLTPMKLLFYIFLSFFTGLQPPLVFCFFELLLLQMPLTRTFQTEWVLLLSLFGTLALFPQWALSLSLCLSFILSISIRYNLNGFRSPLLIRAILIYVILLLPLSSLGTPHPVSILLNLLIAPLISILLLPTLTLGLLHPRLMILFDLPWRQFESLLGLMNELWPQSLETHFFQMTIKLWLYAVLLFLVLRLNLYSRRKRHCS